MRRDPEQKTWLPNYLRRGHCRGKSVMGNRVSRDEHLNTGELVGKPLCMSRLQLPAYRASSAVEAPVEATIGIPLEKHSFPSTWKSISNEHHECINCMYSLTWNQLRPSSLSQLRWPQRQISGIQVEQTLFLKKKTCPFVLFGQGISFWRVSIY